MTDQASLVSGEQALQVAQALLTLAEINGLQITIAIPEKPNTDPHPPVQGANFVDEHQRADLAWLQAELTQHPGKIFQLRGKYVAVHKKRIVVIGEDKGLVLLGASATLGIEPDDILILPVCVEGPDSDDEWLEVRARLGLS